MRLGSISYLPCLKRLNPDAYIRNLEAYKTRYPIHFYSDCKIAGLLNVIDNVSCLKGHQNKVSINNALFIYGLQIAIHEGLDRFLFLETDVRVGCDDWDGILFREAAAFERIAVCGTPSLWNSHQIPIAWRASLNQYVSDYARATGFSPPAFRSRIKSNAASPSNACLFIMGAGAIYDTKTMEELFGAGLANPMSFACQIPAFDLYIGKVMAQRHGGNMVKYLVPSKLQFSTYKQRVFDEQELVKMLHSGRCVLTHQHKGSSDCLPEHLTTRTLVATLAS